MSGTLHGADLAGLGELGGQLAQASQSIRTLTDLVNAGVTESDRFWQGPDAGDFKQQWLNSHRPAMLAAALSLTEASDTIERNRQEQETTSSVDFAGAGASSSGSGVGVDVGVGAGGGGGGAWPGDGTALAGYGAGPISDFLLGDIANLWNGGADNGFPIGQLGAGLLRVFRTGLYLRGGPFPVFNTGLVGRGLAGLLGRVPALSGYGAWLGTPGATTFFTRVGVAGGVIGTGLGLYNLYQQGNPIDAFQENPAGYVSDVASTAFSASTTAFLLAPNPVTAGLVIGTGLIWAGAEVVEHWDDITAWTSDAWDATTGWVGDAAGAYVDSQIDMVTGAWDAGTDLVGDVGDFAGDVVGGVGDLIGVGDWF